MGSPPAYHGAARPGKPPAVAAREAGGDGSDAADRVEPDEGDRPERAERGEAAESPDGDGCLDVYPGLVLLTEILLEPAAALGPDARHLELYNNGNTSLRMEGWHLVSPQGEAIDLQLPAGLDFPPERYLLLGLSADPLATGGVIPDAVLPGGIDRDRGGVSIEAGEITVDAVRWSDGQNWPIAGGRAMSLDPRQMSPAANDRASSWCLADTPLGDPPQFGTPGAPNPRHRARQRIAPCPGPE